MGEWASLGLESVQPSKWTTGHPLCGLRTAARHVEELGTRRSWVGGLLGGNEIGGVFVLFMHVLVVPECTPHQFLRHAALPSQQPRFKKLFG